MKVFRNFSDKHKRMLVIAGCSALCVALVVVIGARFQSKAQGNDVIPSSSAVTPSPDSGTAGTTAEDKTVTAQANTPSSAAANSMPTQTDNSTQDLQPKASKPAAPSESEAKNPSKPPSSSTNSKSSTSSTPQGGSKNSQGQINFPGFGYVSDDGANSGTTVGNSGDQLTGNKVGQMN